MSVRHTRAAELGHNAHDVRNRWCERKLCSGREQWHKREITRRGGTSKEVDNNLTSACARAQTRSARLSTTKTQREHLKRRIITAPPTPTDLSHLSVCKTKSSGADSGSEWCDRSELNKFGLNLYWPEHICTWLLYCTGTNEPSSIFWPLLRRNPWVRENIWTEESAGTSKALKMKWFPFSKIVRAAKKSPFKILLAQLYFCWQMSSRGDLFYPLRGIFWHATKHYVA